MEKIDIQKIDRKWQDFWSKKKENLKKQKQR